MRLIIRFLIYAVSIVATQSSSGDVDPAYHQCIRNCDCVPNSSDEQIAFASSTLIKYLFPTFDCQETCSYNCMQIITKARTSRGYKVLKYYGHWPVIRYFNMEEPASALFSMLNCLPHLIHLLGPRKPRKAQYYMTKWLNVLTIVSLNAWVTSTLYHSKKTIISSRVDYASAFLLLSYSLWVALRRIWGRDANSTVVSTAFTVYASVVISRITEIMIGNFTFQNHMTICISISIIHVSVWLLWILYVILMDQLVKERKRKFTAVHSTCLLCQFLFVVAAMLEIFDFPPFYGIFDAHSLWHLATVPLGFYWYYFWFLDCTYNI